ncbi:type 4a pilus biogenesis protein PilO [Endozoicomonas sp. Mp262]|uniref:type 4a pilus biogenesis protein PilO n=1 Tax=Endozoicomonas sp. Mp262 TaxID=2919499 RepID=UPI0021D91BCB
MSISESVKKLSEIDFNELDLENIGDWPNVLKIVICMVSFIVVIALGYQFHLTDLRSTYERNCSREEELKDQFKVKAFQAGNLEAYKKQLAEMTKQFGELVRQLPEDTEVPGLLDDITLTARGAGLQVEYIKLQTEQVNEFYIELPIKILVKGSYHDFGNFVSGTAALPRIVTLHDLSIKPDGNADKLAMEIIAKTYRYNDRGVPQ